MSLALALALAEFLSRGPKNYAFSVFSPSTGKRTNKCKVIGITLNYESSKVVKFTSLKNMILEDAHLYMFTILRRSRGNVVA